MDTHTFLWWMDDNASLSATARRVIVDEANDIVVSAASAWEIATKCRLGKLPAAEVVAMNVAGCIASEGFEALAISDSDAERTGRLPRIHRDPFDRMLIAQALGHDLATVSIDAALDRYGVSRLW